MRAALEPLRTIPAFTELLLTDPPAAPKQKRTEASEDPQPQPEQPVRKETGGSDVTSSGDQTHRIRYTTDPCRRLWRKLFRRLIRDQPAAAVPNQSASLKGPCKAAVSALGKEQNPG